jgi:hypothetical protein
MIYALSRGRERLGLNGVCRPALTSPWAEKPLADNGEIRMSFQPPLCGQKNARRDEEVDYALDDSGATSAASPGMKDGVHAAGEF